MSSLMHSSRVFLWILLGLFTLTACNPSTVQGDFSLGLSTPTLTNHQGQNSSLNLSLSRTNFSEAIQFSLQKQDGSALPDGVTAAFAPASTAGNTSSLSIAVADTVALGSYDLRVRAAAGSKEKFQNLTLSVDAMPNFELSLASPPATIVRGQSATTTLNIARTNLPDDIALTLEQADGSAAPDIITATFSPNPTSTDSSTLTLSVPANAPVQTYNLRVKGLAGSLSKTSPAFSLAVQEVPSFALSFVAAPAAVNAGNNAVSTLNITRNNFTGNVALSLEKSDGTAAPAGITAAFNPNNTAANSSTLTLTVGAAVTPGPYDLRVKGVSGNLGQTLPFTLTVQAAPAFSLALAAAPASVVQGQSVPMTLNITRTNFASALALSLEKSDGTAAPTGITATFNPNNTTGNSSAVTLATTAAVAAGTYNLRIKGMGGGLTQYSSSFALKVVAVTGTQVTVNIVSQGYSNPTWAAYQDGSASWQPILISGAKYSFLVTDPSGRYGFAFACSTSKVEIYQLITAETTNWNGSCGYASNSPSTTHTLSGTVSGLTTDQLFASIKGTIPTNTLGSATKTSPTYSLLLGAGIQTLIATRYPSSSSNTPEKVIFARNYNLSADATRNFDFEGAEAFGLTGSYAMNSSTQFDNALAQYVVFGPNDRGAAFNISSASQGLAMTYSAIPAAQTQSNDLYLLQMSKGSQSVFTTFHSPTNLNLSFPDLLTVSVNTTTITPYLRPQTTWSKTVGTNLYSVEFYGTGALIWKIGVSAGWLGVGDSYTIPDFSGVSGWQNTWALPTGASMSWNANRFEIGGDGLFNRALFLFNSVYPENSTEFKTVITNLIAKFSTAHGSF